MCSLCWKSLSNVIARTSSRVQEGNGVEQTDQAPPPGRALSKLDLHRPRQRAPAGRLGDHSAELRRQHQLGRLREARAPRRRALRELLARLAVLAAHAD